MTGGRIKRIANHVGNEDFCLTYGDGVSDVNISQLLSFHQRQKRLATLTAIQPPGRFGSLMMDNERITGFKENLRAMGAGLMAAFCFIP